MRGRQGIARATAALGVAGASVALALGLTTGGEAQPQRAASPPLPIAGVSPTGQRYALVAGRRQKDDVPLSWCLRLKYDWGGASIDTGGKRDELAGGVATCGGRPAPRVSGLFVAYCKGRGIYLFGGARSGAGRVALVTTNGKRVRARTTALPRGSGFRGSAFVIAATLDDLPARLESSRGGVVPGTRFPRASKVCVPLPGAREGGQPSGAFPPERRRR